ncbi:ATP-binding protein [Robbsia sp. KACC 23696]|uniref:ATP-binding protein n=1 Tax=Robbsia sp. KACC 23696 TaxID=3149231 RepID=UPI00325B39E1
MAPSAWTVSLYVVWLCLGCTALSADVSAQNQSLGPPSSAQHISPSLFPDLPAALVREVRALSTDAVSSIFSERANTTAGTRDVVRVDAARGTWEGDQPPVEGWEAVTLPDVWTKRWPHHDGVVWYRYRWWHASSPGSDSIGTADVQGEPLLAARRAQETTVLISYWNMAGALYLNGALIDRDVSLTKPLSRSWNTPQLDVLPASLMRPGENTLLLRISGLSAFGPGLGEITVGSYVTLSKRYEREMFLRHDLTLISIAVNFAFGIFFFALWVMRLEQRMYGWFCLTAIAWIIVGYNALATSPWPFQNNTQWQAMVLLGIVLYVWAFTMAMIRYAKRRLPRIECLLRRVLGFDAVAAVSLLVLPGEWLAMGRIVVVLSAAAVFLAGFSCFVWFAVRGGERKHRVVAFATMVFMLAGVHDLLTWLELLSGNLYYSALTSLLEIVSIGFVLVDDFIASIRRVERFNDDLRLKIDETREGLESTLKRQYELQLANARLNERLNLAHDLHDGLGGTLVSSIALLEQHGVLPAERFLPILKELRDDLRIIIDSAAQAGNPERALYESLVPLRHRWTRLFEAQNIDCHWHMTGIETCTLPAPSTLDLMRILQESLTNVLKHSHASRVDITWCATVRQLILIVQDDGVGFSENRDGSPEFGAGLFSIAKRVRRCNGTVRFDNRGGACVTVVVPYESDVAIASA